MTYARKAFIDYHPLDQPIKVNTANGTVIDAIAEGTVRFPVLVEGSKQIIRLNGVLPVPQLAGNLISVPHLQDRGIMTRTAKGGRMLLELEGKLIGVAERIGRTYVLASTEDYIADVNMTLTMGILSD
jgi:hypothetical protein